MYLGPLVAPSGGETTQPAPDGARHTQRVVDSWASRTPLQAAATTATPTKAGPPSPDVDCAAPPAPSAEPSTPVRPGHSSVAAPVDVVKAILTPEPPLTPFPVAAVEPAAVEPAAPEPVASPAPSPAAGPQSSLGGVSPLPPQAVHALPFVPRSVELRQLARAVRTSSASGPGSPTASGLSLNALRAMYKDALIEQRGRWPTASEAGGVAASSTEADGEAGGEEVSSGAAPRTVPRVKVQLASVVVVPAHGAEEEDTQSQATHTLKGLPQGSGAHTRFEDADDANDDSGDSGSNKEGVLLLRGLPAPCGEHIRFDADE